MKGGAFTVRGFELRDPQHLGFWTCERDGYEISCALADDPASQPAGRPYFARVALYGADFGSADGATAEEATTLAFERADVAIQRIAIYASRGTPFMRDVLDDTRQALQVIGLDCASVVSPKLDDEERSEAAARIELAVQRFDLGARILVGFARDGDVEAWKAARRERTAEPAFIPSEPPPSDGGRRGTEDSGTARSRGEVIARRSSAPSAAWAPSVDGVYVCRDSAPPGWAGDRVVVLSVSGEQRTAKVREFDDDQGYVTIVSFDDLVSDAERAS